MSFEAPFTSIDYRLCQYAGCSLKFRGPQIDVSKPFVAVIGSSEVFGRYVHEPFTQLVGQTMQLPIANFGVHNAGLDVFLRDEGLLEILSRASVVVLQVMGALNMSNRFYSVHPRRNDRFVRHSRAMQHLFKAADFSDFVFTRHMMLELQKSGPDAYNNLLTELEVAWRSRMDRLFEAISGKVLLLWVRNGGSSALGPEPLFVTDHMVEGVRPAVSGLVECDVSPHLREEQLDEMVFMPMDREAARMALPPSAHEMVGKAVIEGLEPLVDGIAFSKVGPSLFRSSVA